MNRLVTAVAGLALLTLLAAGCTRGASPTYNLPVGSERERIRTQHRREADMRYLEAVRENWESTEFYGKRFQSLPLRPTPWKD